MVLPAMAYAVNPALFSKVGYTFDQFAPVSIVTKGPLVLVVHPSLGVNSVKELIALAKAEARQARTTAPAATAPRCIWPPRCSSSWPASISSTSPTRARTT